MREGEGKGERGTPAEKGEVMREGGSRGEEEEVQEEEAEGMVVVVGLAKKKEGVVIMETAGREDGEESTALSLCGFPVRKKVGSRGRELPLACAPPIPQDEWGSNDPIFFLFSSSSSSLVPLSSSSPTAGVENSGESGST